MAEKEKKNGTLGGLLLLILVGAGIWYFYGGGIELQVAQDEIKQYEIAERSGNAIDASVHAGIVAAAYLQAHDEANYRKWKDIEGSKWVRLLVQTWKT